MTSATATTTAQTMSEPAAPPPYTDNPPVYSADQHLQAPRSSTSSLEDDGEKKKNGTSTITTTTTNISSISSSSFSPSTPFTPTTHLQIQTSGHGWLSCPYAGSRAPISIWSVDADAGAATGCAASSSSSSGSVDPLYLSIRPDRGSGSCFLVRGDAYRNSSTIGSGSASSSLGGGPKLSTTKYRWGPGRPPRVRVARHPELDRDVDDIVNVDDGEKGGDGDNADVDAFEILGRSALSRSVKFRVPSLSGAVEDEEGDDSDDEMFVWRYGGSKERAANYGANNLLVLEYSVPDDSAAASAAAAAAAAAASADGSSNNACATTSFFSALRRSGKNKKNTSSKKTIKIAQLVRNEKFRSPGSHAWDAGNGGRLMLDLSRFDEKSRDRVQVMAVTTALVMLKKEMDRSQGAQTAVIASA